MALRSRTRPVRIGTVTIGGGHPVAIQSMTKVRTAHVRRVVSQVKSLEAAGCEIIRVAVKDRDDASAIRQIRKSIRIPLVADIHFDHRLALASIASGADKIRINPGNMRDLAAAAEVIRAAKRARIPVRIGVNSGSVGGSNRHGKDPAAELVHAARGHVRLCERLRFRDIVLSLKASDVPTTVEAYRRISKIFPYPLHLGVTASGPREDGIVRSSVGIGSLLLDGIGDTLRVSLTARPDDEIAAAKRILDASGSRHFGPKIVSCPTCGRCQVDLVRIVDALDGRIASAECRMLREKPMTIAVMGCEVNGPGEAKDADIGIAAGKGAGALFVKGKIIRRVAEKDFISEIVKAMKRKAASGG